LYLNLNPSEPMQFFVDNSVYVTLIIAVMILVGLLFYVGRVDARVRRLEKEAPFDSTQS
jgi:hypothetical protein